MFFKKIIGKLASIVRYRNKNDPFSDFENIRAASESIIIPDNNKKLLVLPLRVTPSSNSLEGVLGYAMKLRGYNVHALFDGGSLKISENINISKSRYLHTALSVYEQNRFYKTFKFTPHFFQDLYNKKEIREINREFRLMNIEQLCNFELDGISIGRHAKFGLMRYLMVETIRDEHKLLLVDFLLTALKTKISTQRVIDSINPNLALISHGCYSTWGTALEVLTKNNIETTVWGRGYIGKGNCLFSRNESYLFEYINEPKCQWYDSSLTDADLNLVKKYYLEKRVSGNKVDGLSYYKKNVSGDKELTILKNKNSLYKASVGIYPNIPWDGTMFSASQLCQNIRAFVEKIKLLSEANQDYHFIIRAHPAEVERKTDQTRERFVDILNSVFDGNLPENITYIAPTENVTSYQVSNITDAALIFGSTLSLELAIAGHPVIQLGLTNTSNKSIVFEPKDNEELYNLVSLIRDGKLKMNDNMRDMTLHYGYHWVFRKHVPDTLIDVEAMSYNKFKFSSIDDLNEGNNKTLDFICNSLENKTPIYNQHEKHTFI